MSMFDKDLQFLKAWELRDEDGFTWFVDAWQFVEA